MNFGSLGKGGKLYIIGRGDREKGEGPTLTIGTVTEIGSVHYNVNNPMQQVIDLKVETDKGVIPLGNLACGDESVTYNNGAQYVTTMREGAIREIDGMMSTSKMELDSAPYHNAVLKNGVKIKEQLDPGFAEQNRQKDDINQLKEEVSAMMKMLEKMMGTKKSS